MKPGELADRPEKDSSPQTAAIERWLDARPGESAPRGRLARGECVDGWCVEAFLGQGLSAEVYRVLNAR